MVFCPICKKNYPPNVKHNFDLKTKQCDGMPKLQRLGAGKRCPKCGDWVTGPGKGGPGSDHYCVVRQVEEGLEDDYERLKKMGIYAKQVKEIFKLISPDDQVQKSRVDRTLKMLLVLHHNAEGVEKILETGMSTKNTLKDKQAVVDKVHETLKARYATSQDVFGPNSFVSNPRPVVNFLKGGWDEFAKKWKTLKSAVDKGEYIGKVFEHEKGYPQTAQSAREGMKKGQSLDLKLLTFLHQGYSDTDIFTTWNLPSKMSPAENIQIGWKLEVNTGAAKKKNSDPKFNQYKQMWTKILENLFGGYKEVSKQENKEKFKTLMRNDLKEIKRGFENVLPGPVVDKFVDEHFDSVWEYASDSYLTVASAIDIAQGDQRAKEYIEKYRQA